MRKLIMAGLLASALVPIAASAQYRPGDRQEVGQDRREVRDDRQDLRQDRREVRDDRRDLRQDRHDNRDDARRDFGRDDWRTWREGHRDLYRGTPYRSNVARHDYRPGGHISSGFLQPRYRIAEPWRYHLRRPGFQQSWFRHLNDALLVDTHRGYVIDVIPDFYQ